MTREEEIRQAATKIAKEWYCGPEDEFHCEVEKLEEMGQWADEHPKNPWISVDDRLPEEEDYQYEYNAPHRARSSCNVIITDGVIINRGYFSYARMRWEWNEREIKVTHWMPIPELKGGEKC